MADMFQLASITSSIGEALRANREGNAAARQQALDQAFSLLEGAKSATQTRETITRTTQSQELFPSKLKQEQESATQAGQKTKAGALSLEDAINLRAFFKREHNLDVPPEDLLQGLQAVSGIKGEEAFIGAGGPETVGAGRAQQAELAGRQAETGLQTEASRREVVQADLKAKLGDAKFAQRHNEWKRRLGIAELMALELAETIPMESDVLQAKIAQVDAAKLRAVTDAEKLAFEQQQNALVIEEMEKRKIDPGLVAFYSYMIENKLEPSEDQFITQLGILRNAQARIQTASSVASAIAEATRASGQPAARTDKILQNFFSSAGAPRELTTDADKRKAMSILQEQIDGLERRMAQRPFGGIGLGIAKPLAPEATTVPTTRTEPKTTTTKSFDNLDAAIDKILGKGR